MANSTTQFGGFLTNVGVALQANSAALGLPWSITQMLIGDAGGEPSQTPDPTPNPAQSALVRRVHRAPLNALYKSPADPNVLVAELVLPPEIGGWWIRELGLEDADGNFIAVAKPPPSYKPLLQQGSGRTQTIRMHVVFGNVANINLKIDPSIVLATRDYVDKAREAAELYARNQLKAHTEAADPHPQYLRRADVAKDAGPLAWLGAAAGTADALVLTLKSNEAALPAYAAGQRFQFQAVATNTGAVTAKINGRAAVAVKKASTGGLVDLTAGDLRAGALYDLNYDGTYFQLGGGVSGGRAFERFSFEASVGQTVFSAPHTVGSIIVMRNGREVTDYVADGQKVTLTAPCTVGESVELLAFSSFQTADTYTKAEVQALLKTASALPVGTMLPFPKGAVPAGFLEVDGSVQSAAVYPDLAAYLGSTFNTGGEGAGFFRLPDSRGEFLRGWDHGRGVDAGRAIGSWQNEAYGRHNHAAPGWGNSSTDATGGTYFVTADSGGAPTGDITTMRESGGPETRPRNLAVMWCFKAWNAPVNQGNIDVAELAAEVQALRQELVGPQPLSVFDYPAVATADGRMAITAAGLAGTGGTLSVPAGVTVTLVEEVTAGEQGRPRVKKTVAWTSAGLPINATLYLRANIQGGALVLYVAPGSDLDALPASLRAEADRAASGFDSTVIDVLLAKVVTGAAGTVPTVTALANKRRLEAIAFWSGAIGTYSITLNWARAPRAYIAGIADYDGNSKSDYTVVAEPIGTEVGGSTIGPSGGFSDRYAGRVIINAYIPTGSVGPGKINARVRWEA
ncbi:phage tail protein [Pseudomonas sichuanensis]|uniref:phage tail-collar fiber domain-containing protein n=1 Tax=Pseudomonas sichuanensis TaxID=2213015 RepID=UPI0021604AC7|nr:phage tail protein [Pseudomonas sichuanensis]UVK80699.1 phage tail protein [Pseudomonas sichuanensis]